MKYKLILVEGLPGTGKTTLSKQIFNLLSKQGTPSSVLLEENTKIPSNFYNIAGVPINDFIDFAMPFITKTDNYFFVDLGNCTEEAKQQLLRYDIGDEFNKYISAEEYSRCTLEWWQNWVANNTNEPVLILDSAFMQCPINEMIFRGASNPEVSAYIKAISEIIEPLHPICVYLRRESAKVAIDFAKTVKGVHWANGIDSLAHSDFPDLFERRFYLENALLHLVPNIVCDINGSDWSDAELKTSEILATL